MSTFVFVTWNRGGNVTPALGIARALAERRHTIAFLGEASQRRQIEAAGLAFTAYTRRPDWDGAPPQTPAERQRLLMRTIWMNDGLADDLTAVLARSPADLVVVDCMLAGILANSPRFGAPTAVLVHSLFASVLDVRDALVTMGNRLRVEAGLPALDAAAMKWEHKDLVLVTTLREFDGVTADPAPHVRYVGSVFERQPPPPDWRLPWDHDDPRPLVLASFSTMPGQSSPATLQLVLDALESLPVRVLLTTGPFSPKTLTTPPERRRLWLCPARGDPAARGSPDQPRGTWERDGRPGPRCSAGVYAGPRRRPGHHRRASRSARRGQNYSWPGRGERASQCRRAGDGNSRVSRGVFDNQSGALLTLTK
jgi:UDP:flavonoid glycosyltransferase YjiC (YdhE family)